MPDSDEDNFCKKMRYATREIHAISDALVNAKLAFGLMDDKVWADGLLVFYEVFRYLEGAMLRLKNTKIGQLRIEGLERTEAFEKDLKYYLGRGWMKNYTPSEFKAIYGIGFTWISGANRPGLKYTYYFFRDSVAKYLMRLREIEDTDSLLLMAYIYHLYMGLLSGGIILRKKRQLVQKMSPFKDAASNDGNSLTDFGEYNIYELKRELRNTMNRIADTLDEDTKNKLLEESKTVYILNNEIIRSVHGAGTVLIKKLLYFFIAIVLIIVVFHTLFQ